VRRAICLAASFAVLAAGDRLAVAQVAPPPDFPDKPPQAPPLQPATLPPAYSEKLPNGMDVLVVSSDEIPWVSIAWNAPAGAKFDPPDKSGLAGTTADLLRQGTQKHTGDELAEEVDFHAIQLGGGAGHELAGIRAGALSKDADLAVGFLAEIIRTPVFPEKELKRHIAQVVSGMKVAEAQAEYWAEREIRERIYGPHYLGRLPSGTSDSLLNITRDDLVAFHQTHYLPNGSTLVFSGDIKPEAAVELARKHFGDWPAGELPVCEVPPVPPRQDTHIYLVNRPGSTQSHLRVGQSGYRRTDPQYIPGQVFNQVFGGSFNSRLNSTVRVKEGLTYGAGGGFSAEKEPGRLIASTFTKNETTAATIKAVLGVIASMGTEEPTAEELSDAQSSITGSFGLSLETPQDVAGRAFDLKFYGLPGNYYETYLQEVNRLTASQIIEFARQNVENSKLTIVVVGDAKEVQQSLEEIAPVTVVEREEKPSAE